MACCAARSNDLIAASLIAREALREAEFRPDDRLFGIELGGFDQGLRRFVVGGLQAIAVRQRDVSGGFAAGKAGRRGRRSPALWQAARYRRRRW